MDTQTTTTDRKTIARNLYLHTQLTQAQIAEHIGVSQKTVSLYISENKWDILKTRASQAPAMFVDHMISELQELNNTIAARPEGKRFPTLREAEIRRKIMYSLSTVKEQQSISSQLQSILGFLKYVIGRNIRAGRFITRYADEYLIDELKIPEAQELLAYFNPGAPLSNEVFNKNMALRAAREKDK